MPKLIGDELYTRVLDTLQDLRKYASNSGWSDDPITKEISDLHYQLSTEAFDDWRLRALAEGVKLAGIETGILEKSDKEYCLVDLLIATEKMRGLRACVAVAEQTIINEVWTAAGGIEQPVNLSTLLTCVRLLRRLVDSRPRERTDQEIVDQTEKLAGFLLEWGFNHQIESPKNIRNSEHPFAHRSWHAACLIQAMLTNTDVENAVSYVDDKDE